jgi:uncharacterized protein YukE
MGTYNVNYDEVNAEVRRLRNHVSSNIINQANTEYRQIRNYLREVDGATCESFTAAMDQNCEKTVAAARVLERLLSFISNSSRQIQINEEQIARSFRLTRR